MNDKFEDFKQEFSEILSGIIPKKYFSVEKEDLDNGIKIIINVDTPTLGSIYTAYKIDSLDKMFSNYETFMRLIKDRLICMIYEVKVE